MDGNVLEETDLAGNLQNDYVFLRGERVAKRDSTGAVYLYLKDVVGSTAMLTDANANVKNSSDFYPFGGERVITSTLTDHYKFTGLERGSETGLDHTLFRQYSSGLGRWLTPDPICKGCTNPQKLNRYQYALDNPVTLTDPLGLDDVPPWWISVDVWAPFPGNPFGGGGGGEDLFEVEVDPVTTASPAAGAGGTVFPIDPITDTTARFLLKGAFKGFEKSNCAKVFAKVIAGFTASDFESKAFGTNYYNARATPFGNWSQDTVTGNGVSTTLNNSLPAGATGITINAGQGKQTAVLLGADFFAEPTSKEINDLLHEDLHAYTDWSDSKIFGKFRGFGLTQQGPGTIDISNWIGTDCNFTPKDQ